MCNRIQEEPSKINLSITGFVLTPLACSSLINEIIKCLLYEKSQIPYSHNWLKNIVCKKRKSLENEQGTTRNHYTAKKYYNIVSKAYDALDEIMENLSKEFKNKSSTIHEILIMFGVTPLNPKETISINFTNITHDHVEVNHVQSNFKKQRCILRNLFLSEEWSKGISKKIPITNMYIMLKKTENNICTNENFTLIRNYNVPMKNCVRIQLECDKVDNLSCCNNLLIFNEITKHNEADELIETSKEIDTNMDHQEIWFQSNVIFKGFKDCYINKVHASELW